MTRKQGRARLTNDPMKARAPGHTAQSKRLRDLFEAFTARIGADDVIGRSAALRCAELTAATEGLRRQIMDDDLSDADDVKLTIQAKLAEQLIRLENLADRAERRLANLVEARPAGPTLADVIREDRQEQHK
jgi:hypothetical protein